MKPKQTRANNDRWKNTDKELYRKWRQEVVSRDRRTCQLCTKRFRGSRSLQVHHIHRWADSPGLRYIPSNGILLCVPCHRIVTGNEAAYAAQFAAIVDSNTRKISTVGLGMILAKYSKTIDIKKIAKILRNETIEEIEDEIEDETKTDEGL